MQEKKNTGKRKGGGAVIDRVRGSSKNKGMEVKTLESCQKR